MAYKRSILLATRQWPLESLVPFRIMHIYRPLRRAEISVAPYNRFDNILTVFGTCQQH